MVALRRTWDSVPVGNEHGMTRSCATCPVSWGFERDDDLDILEMADCGRETRLHHLECMSAKNTINFSYGCGGNRLAHHPMRTVLW